MTGKDAPRSRIQLLQTLKSRIQPLIYRNLTLRETLIAVVACCFADHSDATDVLFDRHTSLELSKNVEAVRLSGCDLTFVLSTVACKSPLVSTTTTTTTNNNNRIVSDLSEAIASVERRLLSTLGESDAQVYWKHNSTKIAVVASFLCPELDSDRLRELLGSFVESDSRRVEDLHSEGLNISPILMSHVVEFIVDTFMQWAR